MKAEWVQALFEKNGVMIKEKASVPVINEIEVRINSNNQSSGLNITTVAIHIADNF